MITDSQFHIKIIWKNAPGKGAVEVVRGKLARVEISSGKGRVEKNKFSFPDGGEGAVKIRVSDAKVAPGAFASIVRLKAGEDSFAFFLRDALHPDSPVWVSENGAAVVPGADGRSYDDIVRDILDKNCLSDFAGFEAEPEENFRSAAGKNLTQYCPTWLGISRDMRLFRFGYQERYNYFGTISPFFINGRQDIFRESDINFVLGQGSSCRPDIKRRLDGGCLPIVRAVQKEKFMCYNITAFASLETRPLVPGAVKGTHWLAAYANTQDNMLGKEKKEALKDFISEEMYGREEEVVLLCRVEAENTGRVPCYAWFKAPYLRKGLDYKMGLELGFDGKKGFSLIDGNVLSVNLLNGEPSPEEELAVLVQPGEKAVFEMIVPHAAVNQDRALKLLKLNFSEHLKSARNYWTDKLKSSAEFILPEKEINEAVRAGLLHCDIAAYGREPDETVAPTIGVYSPIGTESSPIIQFFDSVGWHKLAERSIRFFCERQLESGFIQNYARYESETGPFLWTIGEHFRYTGDVEWLKGVMPNVKKAVAYLLNWREENKKEEYREKGCYGLVSGKVADPDLYVHSFFLNAGCYAGLKRISEITKNIDSGYSAGLKKEVQEYRKDIREGFYHTQALSPVAPFGDGSWVPLMPSCVSQYGSSVLYAEGKNSFSHGVMASRDMLTGPIWLVILEVLFPDEKGVDFMLKSNQFPHTVDNACLGQPYYCRHDFAHIKRGETRAFLKAYYNQVTGIADRETYSFMEHYFGVPRHGEHKTHEEAWFLMQTRWMLYLEEGNSITIFPAIPAKWLESGKKVEVKNAASYFGKISFNAVSRLDENNLITASFECGGGKKPDNVRIRLPHPRRLKALKAEGGNYDPASETVTVKGFNGKCDVRLFF